MKFHIRKIELLAFDTQYYLIHTKKPIQTGRKNRYWRKSSSIVQDEGSVILTKKWKMYFLHMCVYKIYVWTFRNADRNEKRNKKLKGIAVGDKQKQIQL